MRLSSRPEISLRLHDLPRFPTKRCRSGRARGESKLSSVDGYSGQYGEMIVLMTEAKPQYDIFTAMIFTMVGIGVGAALTLFLAPHTSAVDEKGAGVRKMQESEERFSGWKASAS